MLEHLPGKIRQIATSLQRWNFYHQNTGNTATYSKNLKRVFFLPKHSENDHEIVLEAPGKLATGYIYNTNEEETKVLQVYIEKNLKKGYIRYSKSKITQPVMFVPKKNGELKMCVDYNRINAVTVKNKYPLPLMADMKSKFKTQDISQSWIYETHLISSKSNKK